MLTYHRMVCGLGLVAFALLPGKGFAQGNDCEFDADCDQGFSCEVTGSSGCAGMDCPPNEPDCKPVDCEPQTFLSCVPAECEANADCAAGWTCLAGESDPCATTPCEPGSDCEPAPDCMTSEQSRCVPLYTLPCERASDCGDGFDCVTTQREQCMCSGGGGSATPGTGAGGAAEAGLPAPKPPAARDGGGAPTTNPDCSCTTQETSYCKVQAIECASDGDCPATWTCSPQGDVDPSEPPAAVDGGSAEPEPKPESEQRPALAAAADGGTLSSGAPDAAVILANPVTDAGGVAAPGRICIPPYYSQGPRDDDSEDPTGEGDGSSSPEEGADAGLPPTHAVDAAAPGGPTSDADADGEPTGTSEDASATTTDETNDADGGDDGCACSTVGTRSNTTPSAAWLSVLMSFGLVWRRRSRA